MIDLCEKILVIGIGNEFRGDDGAGVEVSRRLAKRAVENVTVSRYTGDGTSLIDLWQGYDAVILVDAVISGGEPGKIYRFDRGDLDNEGFPASVSTHGFGLGETVRYFSRPTSRDTTARSNMLPPRS